MKSKRKSCPGSCHGDQVGDDGRRDSIEEMFADLTAIPAHYEEASVPVEIFGPQDGAVEGLGGVGLVESRRKVRGISRLLRMETVKSLVDTFGRRASSRTKVNPGFEGSSSGILVTGEDRKQSINNISSITGSTVTSELSEYPDPRLERRKYEGLLAMHLELLMRYAELEKKHHKAVSFIQEVEQSKEQEQKNKSGKRRRSLDLSSLLNDKLSKVQSELKSDSEMVRVLVPVYPPVPIYTKETVGCVLFGYSKYQILHYVLITKGLGWASLFLWAAGMMIGAMQMTGNLPYDGGGDFFCGVLLLQEMLVFAVGLNNKICMKLLRRFELWFGIVNSLALITSLLILFEGKRHIYFLGMGCLPSSIGIWFTDALPPGRRIILCKFLFPLLIVLFSTTQLALFLNWFTMVPFGYNFGGITWTASVQASSSLWTLIIFFMRYFMLSMRHPNTLVILKAPIISVKKPKCHVDMQRQLFFLSNGPRQ